MHIRFQGVEVGCKRDDPLTIADYAPPMTEVDPIRTPNLGRDGVHAGSDYLRSSAWDFSLSVTEAGTAGVLGRAGLLERAWKDKAVRSAGATPLEYSTDHGASWHRVYGRPLRYTGPKADFMAAQGYGAVEIQFEQTDPLHYSSTTTSTTITAAPAVIGGWSFPLSFPLSTAATGAERAGRVTNAGDKPTPVQVTFHGPCSNPVVTTSHGYEVGYRGTLAWDQHVTLDPMAGSVLLNGTVPVPGRLTVRSILSDLVAPAGNSDWFYRATDPTGTSRAVLEWRSAFTSMQYGGS